MKTTYYLHMKPRHTAEQSTVKVNKAEAIAGTSGAPKKGFGAAAGASAGSTAGADTGAGAPAEAPAGAPARKGFGFGGAVKAGE